MGTLSILTGCKKEQDQSLKLEAVIENVSDGQKVHIGTYNGHNLPYWDANDEVRVNNETGSIAFDNTTSYIQINNTASTYCAIYPSSCLAANTNITTPSNISITLPKEQVYQENSGNQIVRLPMIAYSNTTDLHFKNLCSVFKITVTNGTTEDVVLESIVLKATANSGGAPVNLWGTATVSLAADAYTDQNTPAGISTLTNTAADRHYVTLKNIHKTIPYSGNTSRDFYIVVPTTNTATDYTVQLNYLGGYVSYAAATNKTLARSHLVKYPVSARNLGFNDAVKALTIIGPFTVDANGTKVGFAKGNLWYSRNDNGLGGDGKFHFETHQYDYTSIPRNGFPNTVHISYFWWDINASTASGDANYCDAPYLNSTHCLFTNKQPSSPTMAEPTFVVEGVKGKFRALSSAEWNYLTSSRTSLTSRGCAVVRLTDVNKKGLVILPDIATNVNPASLTTMSAITTAGAAFLPEAGGRVNQWDGNYTYNEEINGGYWASDNIDDEHAQTFVFFTDGSIYTASGSHVTGRTIRLVVNYPPANKTN